MEMEAAGPAAGERLMAGAEVGIPVAGATTALPELWRSCGDTAQWLRSSTAPSRSCGGAQPLCGWDWSDESHRVHRATAPVAMAEPPGGLLCSPICPVQYIRPPGSKGLHRTNNFPLGFFLNPV
ncbi:hypothetical protein KSP40_PGU019043 [Platanthera guangdongensis]|uniref:Uncharacterized protein n=1 Tax=Platanthera guangdongensis TaxID=2320717 RepID=A0ABR2M6T0_9ASPA